MSVKSHSNSQSRAFNLIHQLCVFSSNLFNSFHTEQVEANSHDLADGLKQEDPARLLRRILHTNLSDELADLNSDVVD